MPIVLGLDPQQQFGYVYLMKHKSEAFDKFKEYQSMVEKQTEKCIKILRSDRGGEYLSSEFLNYLKEKGILSEWTLPYMPQLNGVAEWRNRTLLDIVRSMMCFTDLPIFFCDFVLMTAALVLNRVPSKYVLRGNLATMPHVTGTRAQEDYGCPLIQQSDLGSDIFGTAARPRVGCPLIQQSDLGSDIFGTAARPRVGCPLIQQSDLGSDIFSSAARPKSAAP